MVKRRKECLFNCSIIGIQRILMRGNQKRERIFSSISLPLSVVFTPDDHNGAVIENGQFPAHHDYT